MEGPLFFAFIINKLYNLFYNTSFFLYFCAQFFAYEIQSYSP